MDFKKKGEIFETHNGKLIFICCICNASNVGLLEVETHLKTHIEFVLSTTTSFMDRDIAISEEIDSKVWLKIEPDSSSNEIEDRPIAPVPIPTVNPTSNQLPKEVPRKRPYNSPATNFFPIFKQYKCDICAVIADQKYKIKSHIETIHVGLRSHECNICGHKFAARANLMQHINRHNSVKKYKCDECGKAFVSSTERKAHIRAHRGERNYVCTICGKAYVTSGAFSTHRRHVHMNDRKFMCEYSGCRKSFFEVCNLKIHERAHTGERPFNCEICNKDFANRKVLGNHRLLHSNDKKYNCKFCPSKFAQSSGRRGHERRVHGAE